MSSSTITQVKTLLGQLREDVENTNVLTEERAC